jgi:hypothetical protein
MIYRQASRAPVLTVFGGTVFGFLKKFILPDPLRKKIFFNLILADVDSLVYHVWSVFLIKEERLANLFLPISMVILYNKFYSTHSIILKLTFYQTNTQFLLNLSHIKGNLINK